MRAKRNIKTLYVISFFFSLIPAYVIERLFWEMRGMSVLDVVLTEVIFGAVMLLMEVPSGVLADRIGRKPLIVTGVLFEGLMFAILLTADSFWQFGLAIAFAAAGAALLSGAENALLYDSLAAVNREERFDWHIGRLQAVRMVSLFIAAMSGSFLAVRVSLEVNYWLSLSSTLIAFLLTFLLKDVERKGDESEFTMAGQVIEAVRFFKKQPALVYVLILGITVGLAAGFVEEFWQLYLVDAGISISFFGLFYGVILIVQIPGALAAHSLRKRFERGMLLKGVILTGAAALILSAVQVNWLGAAAIIFFLLAAGMTEPLIMGALHEKADSRIRATIESFQSFVFNAVLIGAGTGFGYIATRFTLASGFLFLAVFSVVPLVLRTLIKLNR
ncbi:MFS transporter [Jeotgalibacillus haloalkalitolerans]|uniref:MFS transporter n=1 Tax=Jeotgalibacillus haloalkalitolerans TaxID=3104292 RepID=A0ABU5KHY2_9BACL|nr:MFS transporter [Jeotgalibacillus sp. HH7-29]MDZ5710785.1 MFS transporter [Jeotgalibacillus sp. HH7-29]